MMKKTIKTGKVEKITVKSKKKAPEATEPQESPAVKGKVDPKTYMFPKGSKYMLEEQIYWVREEYREDNTDFRKVYSNGDEFVIMLSTLRADAGYAPDFMVVE